MGRTLPLRNSNTQTGAQTQRHTCWMFTQVPGGCCAFSRSCATVNLYVVASTGFKMKDIPHQWSPKKKKKNMEEMNGTTFSVIMMSINQWSPPWISGV